MTMRKTLTAALIAALLAVVPGAIATLRAQAPGAPREGIVVHGHWTIDIREPDGRLVSHREFENALDKTTGAAVLSDILARRLTMGRWIVLVGSATVPPCVGIPESFAPDSKPPVDCEIHEKAENIRSDYQDSTLSLGATGLTMTGTVTATIGANGGSIDRVRTQLSPCPSSYTPATCAVGTAYTGVFPSIFSSADVPAQTVVAGQIISVTVTFTFS